MYSSLFRELHNSRMQTPSTTPASAADDGGGGGGGESVAETQPPIQDGRDCGGNVANGYDRPVVYGPQVGLVGGGQPPFHAIFANSLPDLAKLQMPLSSGPLWGQSFGLLGSTYPFAVAEQLSNRSSAAAAANSVCLLSSRYMGDGYPFSSSSSTGSSDGCISSERMQSQLQQLQLQQLQQMHVQQHLICAQNLIQPQPSVLRGVQGAVAAAADGDDDARSILAFPQPTSSAEVSEMSGDASSTSAAAAAAVTGYGCCPYESEDDALPDLHPNHHLHPPQQQQQLDDDRPASSSSPSPNRQCMSPQSSSLNLHPGSPHPHPPHPSAAAAAAMHSDDDGAPHLQLHQPLPVRASDDDDEDEDDEEDESGFRLDSAAAASILDKRRASIQICGGGGGGGRRDTVSGAESRFSRQPGVATDSARHQMRRSSIPCVSVAVKGFRAAAAAAGGHRSSIPLDYEGLKVKLEKLTGTVTDGLRKDAAKATERARKTSLVSSSHPTASASGAKPTHSPQPEDAADSNRAGGLPPATVSDHPPPDNTVCSSNGIMGSDDVIDGVSVRQPHLANSHFDPQLQQQQQQQQLDQTDAGTGQDATKGHPDLTAGVGSFFISSSSSSSSSTSSSSSSQDRYRLQCLVEHVLHYDQRLQEIVKRHEIEREIIRVRHLTQWLNLERWLNLRFGEEWKAAFASPELCLSPTSLLNGAGSASSFRVTPDWSEATRLTEGCERSAYALTTGQCQMPYFDHLQTIREGQATDDALTQEGVTSHEPDCCLKSSPLLLNNSSCQSHRLCVDDVTRVIHDSGSRRTSEVGLDQMQRPRANSLCLQIVDEPAESQLSQSIACSLASRRQSALAILNPNSSRRHRHASPKDAPATNGLHSTVNSCVTDERQQLQLLQLAQTLNPNHVMESNNTRLAYIGLLSSILQRNLAAAAAANSIPCAPRTTNWGAFGTEIMSCGKLMGAPFPVVDEAAPYNGGLHSWSNGFRHSPLEQNWNLVPSSSPLMMMKTVGGDDVTRQTFAQLSQDTAAEALAASAAAAVHRISPAQLACPIPVAPPSLLQSASLPSVPWNLGQLNFVAPSLGSYVQAPHAMPHPWSAPNYGLLSLLQHHE